MLNSLPLDAPRRALLAQFARYALTGVALTLLGVAVYWGLAEFAGVAPLLANVGAYLAAASIGYVAHSRFSFRGHGSRDNTGVRTARFLIVSLVSFGLNSLWVWVGTGLMAGPTWWPIPAMVFVTPVVVFTLNRKWVFA